MDTALPLVIVNPTSAGGRTRDVWAGIASELAAGFGPFKCEFTKHGGHANALAATAVREGRRFIVACGGDGTISEVANGILEAGGDAVLGVLPSGTGGDFRRSIDVPNRLKDAVALLRNGRTKRVDAGRAEYQGVKGTRETRYFLGVASFGLSGEVIRRVKENTASWSAILPQTPLSGRVDFAASMLKTAFQTPGKSVIVTVDGREERRLTTINYCIANARYFGGGMKVAPNAILDDGFFDVVNIGNLSPIEILVRSPQLYAGTHLGITGVEHQLAKTVSARAADDQEKILLEVDGELPGTLPAKFEIISKAINVRVR
jgi:diacylglycerol kinase (ATP)